ncbi:MAG: hypothetical protein HOP29_19540 [Phycisphaerales bacterium]|nr:hypothetical protein [Phycisphaerales bacterium]
MVKSIVTVQAIGVIALITPHAFAGGEDWTIRASGVQVEVAAAASPEAQGPGAVPDECEERIPLPWGLSPFSTVGATTSGDVDPFCDGPVFHDIWINLFPFLSGRVTVTVQANFPPRIAALDGCSCAPLSQVLTCSSASPTLETEIQFDVAAGNCYKLDLGSQVPGQFGNGTINISVQQDVPAATTWGAAWMVLLLTIAASLAIRGRRSMTA